MLTQTQFGVLYAALRNKDRNMTQRELSKLVISFAVAMIFVYNPMTAAVHSKIFLITTGSGFTAIFGGLLYYIASITPLKKYMLRDRNDLEIV